MKNAIIYTIVFLAIQVIAGFMVKGAWMLIYGEGAQMGAL